MKILALNSGSSSIKFQLFEMPGAAPIGSRAVERLEPSRDPRPTFEKVLGGLRAEAPGLAAVGHRVVHGGGRFREPAKVDEETLEAIRALSPLAPLHNPVNVAGIEIASRLFPGAAQVAVFDTAFHATLPEHAYRYAIPRRLFEENGALRRFGFHGISCAYVARRAAAFLGRPPGEVNLVVLHLGNGASAAAIRGGRSVDTSMGMTPLEGLVMGTRSGDLDPAIPLRLARGPGASAEAAGRILDEESGLRGLAGSSDLREVLRRAAEGDAEARLAVDLYAYRIKKYVGAYAAVLGRIDAVVFTGGIGENSSEIRARSLEGLQLFGIATDPAKNAAPSRAERSVGAAGMAVEVLVIPTDEELEIATQAAACVERSKAGR